MPTVAPTIAQIVKVSKVKAEFWQNLLNLDIGQPVLHQWICYSTDCRFKTANFQTKKGSATINLGLNYCSMGLSQPSFCDTVP
jgi:hypothetical protein